MTLGTAVVLLLLAIAGLIACCICLRGKKALRRVLEVLLSLISLALIGYIALTLLFVAAVRGQTPA